MLHVPYEGVAPALTALLGGEMQVPKVREFFVNGGWEPLGSSPEALRAYVDAELKRYAEAVRVAKIKPE